MTPTCEQGHPLNPKAGARWGRCACGWHGRLPRGWDTEPAPAPEPARAERDNGVRLADVDNATRPLDEPLRAMIRLMLDAAAERHHRRHAHADGHMAGLAAGPTQTGKTLAGVAVCTALGLDPGPCVRETGRESELSLWGRRVARAGSPGEYMLVPADVLGFPFLVLDELDKATGALRNAALRLLQGDARIPAEGMIVDLAPAVYATSNATLASTPEPYLRRAVRADTTGLASVSYVTARAVLDAMPVIPFRLLPPPADALPAGTLTAMQDTLRACLTGDGWQLCDLRGLEGLALARAGLDGRGDLDAAAVAVTLDYLECESTTGAARADWQQRMRRLGDDGRLPPDTEAAGPDPVQEAAAAYSAEVGAIVDAGVLLDQVGLAARGLLDAIEPEGLPAGVIPAGWHSVGMGLLRGLRRVHHDLGAVDDPAPLLVMAATVQQLLAAAVQLAGRCNTIVSAAREAAARQLVDKQMAAAIEQRNRSYAEAADVRLTANYLAQRDALTRASGERQLQANISAWSTRPRGRGTPAPARQPPRAAAPPRATPPPGDVYRGPGRVIYGSGWQ